MEIEHIIPQAKGGTDTYNNLCLVNCNDNLNKSDRYAYEYFEETKTQEEIREILKMPVPAPLRNPGDLKLMLVKSMKKAAIKKRARVI